MDDTTQIWGTVVAIAIVILILGIAVGVRISDTGGTAQLHDDYRALQRTHTKDSLAVVNQCTKIHYLELQHVVDSTRMVDYQRYIKLMEKSR